MPIRVVTRARPEDNEFVFTAEPWDRYRVEHREMPPVDVWERMSPREEGEWRLKIQLEQVNSVYNRTPGWKMPQQDMERTPMYRLAVVSISTPWGDMVISSGLARIYDADGWPDEETFRGMVEQQQRHMRVTS